MSSADAQVEITRPTELLDDRGRLVTPGFARFPYWRYDRRRIAAPWWRIKEWDYYAVIDETDGAGFAVTFSDLGYIGLVAVCVFDLEAGRLREWAALRPFSRGRLGLHPDCDEPHELRFDDPKRSVSVEISRSETRRRLRFAVTGDGNGGAPGSGAPGSGAPGQEAAAEVTLFQPPDQERMVIATHWPGELQAFYYNQKINCMPAEGHLDIGAERREFHQAHTFATLDWGRGRWTYRNHWYWASASGTCEGTAVGINLGYGFSDRSPATENMLFYDYRAHKLGDVGMERDPERILEPWRITDADGRLELRFRPRLNRHADFNLVLARSRQDQVFGYFDGRAVLDDGTPLYLQALPGFVEDVYNRW